MPSINISLDLFQEVFEKVTDIAVNLLNKDYTVLWVNRMMAIQVERPLDEIIGKPCYEAWRRRDTPCPVCLLQIVSDTGKPCVMERWLDLPNKERRYAEVRAYPIFDDKGFVKHVFEILMPLTHKKKDEKRRKRYIESLEGALRELNASVIDDRGKTSTGESAVTLTRREREILRLIAKGFSNREIADILSISPDTVKTHTRNIFSKLSVTDRTQAAVWAASHKLA